MLKIKMIKFKIEEVYKNEYDKSMVECLFSLISHLHI